jgi:hypothetical protein
MTLPVLNQGDQAGLFQRAQEQGLNQNLITDQLDPTQPQIQGLDRITDPLIPSENSTQVVENFDPEIYDLKPTSHLMRFIRALTGSAGVGGIRKQNFIARASTSILGASFVDLDAFYGALFNFHRSLVETMPLNVDGTKINPLTDIAPSDVWDDVYSRDARFRSRIHQLARAINMGGSYAGLKAVAEAILSIDVDLVESWVKVDALINNSSLVLPVAKTYGQISSQYVTDGNMKTVSYGNLEGNQFGNGNTPQGNRGELVFTPRRAITPEESYQLMKVLQVLKPSHTQITISNATNQTSTVIAPRSLAADSENWSIQSRITPAINLIQPTPPLYQNSGEYSVARPVFSEYVGESWSNNVNIVKTNSYSIDDGTAIQGDDEVITYNDGQSHIYRVQDGIMDTHKAISTRLSGDGVVTTYPYAGNRIQYASV